MGPRQGGGFIAERRADMDRKTHHEGGPPMGAMFSGVKENIRRLAVRFKRWREPELLCVVCGAPIDVEESAFRWCEFREVYIHMHCIPPVVRIIGEDQVKVWLRHGSSAFFQGMARPINNKK